MSFHFQKKSDMSVKKYRLDMLYHKSKPYHRERLSYEFVLFQQYEHVMQEHTTKTDTANAFHNWKVSTLTSRLSFTSESSNSQKQSR